MLTSISSRERTSSRPKVDTSMGIEVLLARDARLHHQLYPDAELSVKLHGRIVGKYGRSSKLKFYALQDVTENIQVMVDRSVLEDEIWEAFLSLQEGDGVEVHGTVGLSRSGKLTVFPTSAPKRFHPLTVRDLLADEVSGVATQMLLARLENRCRRYLEEHGFIELAARYLSTSWSSGGLQPLNVVFPGQSKVPLYLAVSPTPQLMRAILAVGQSEFFTISRSFATNFIATQNGAESVLGGAILVGKHLDEASDLALPIVKDLINDYTTGLDPDVQQEWDIPHTRSSSSSLDPPNVSQGLHLHTTVSISVLKCPGDFDVDGAFRIQWRGELVLAEGFSFMIGDTSCAVINLYLERFLPLLRVQDNRRIGDLVHPSSADEQ